MLPLLVAFAAGIGVLQLQASLPSPAWAPMVVAGLLAAIAARFGGPERSQSRARFLLVVVATGVAGFGYAAWRADVRLADALAAEWEGEDLAIVGVVDGLPRASARGQRFAFAVESVEPPHARVPARVSLAWQQLPIDAVATDLPAVRAGERWSLTVRLRRPHGNLNPGGFDLEAWLVERNLRATGYVRSEDSNRRLDPWVGRPLDYVARARETIRDRALATLADEAHAGVLVALAIGDQSGIDERAWTVFNRTGTGHLVSVSGLHVTVFAWMAGGIAFALARRSTRLTARLPARKVAAVFGLLASCGYVLLAGAEVPAQRTLAMLGVAAFGLWLGRPGSGVLVWTWALVTVLAWDPWAFLAPGFWLSFFAVGLLIYASHSGGVRNASAWRWLADAVRSQGAITIGLVPLSLALFQQVSLIGPVANAIAIPAVTFAIVPVTLAAALLGLNEAWQLAHALFTPLMRLLETLAALPGAAWAQHQPPAWAVASGIVGVALCLAPRGIPGRALAGVFLAPLVFVLPAAPAPGTFRMTVLDVGQGTAIVVQTHAHALLYDTGPGWHEGADAGGRIVAPFLRAAGIRKLDAMIVSHRDLDHSGGALSVLAAIPVATALTSLSDDHPIVIRLRERGVHLGCRAGQHWNWDGVRFEIVFPDTAHYSDPWRKSNDMSCVLRIAGEGGSALVAGDIEARSEIELVTSHRHALAADVVIVPHHGSRTSSTSSFVAAVSPRHAVFSVGYRNRFGHPRADVVERYRRAGANLYRTDASGALTFGFAPPGPMPPAAERERASRYWHARP